MLRRASAPSDLYWLHVCDTLETATSSSSISTEHSLLPGMTWPSSSMTDLIAGIAFDEGSAGVVPFLWKHRQDHLRKGVTAAGDAERLLAVFPYPIPESTLQDWQKRIKE
jgi:hypothetical protein